MIALHQHQVPIAIQADGVELRKQSLGELTVAFVQARKGIDLRPALKGLPQNLCPCPHWAYVIKGTIRMHTADGHQDFSAGQACYWAPGHAPEVLEDAEYVDFSPTQEFDAVIRHIVGQSSAART